MISVYTSKGVKEFASVTPATIYAKDISSLLGRPAVIVSTDFLLAYVSGKPVFADSYSMSEYPA